MSEAVSARRGPSARRGSVSARRKDPRSRDPRGVTFGGLINEDPTRKYVRANKTGHYAVNYYEHLGYEVEVVKEGGVKFAGGLKTAQPGEAVTWMDTVLMSIDMEAYEDLVQFGADGQSGQAYADMIEDRIIDKNSLSVDDPMRGIFKSIPGTTVHKSVRMQERRGASEFESLGDESGDSQ